MGYPVSTNKTSAPLREMTGTKSAGTVTREGKWRYFGHLLRMDPDRLPARLLDPPGNSDLPRRRGRPHKVWSDRLVSDAQMSRTHWVAGKHSLMRHFKPRAQDRKRWRSLTLDISKRENVV